MFICSCVWINIHTQERAHVTHTYLYNFSTGLGSKIDIKACSKIVTLIWECFRYSLSHEIILRAYYGRCIGKIFDQNLFRFEISDQRWIICLACDRYVSCANLFYSSLPLHLFPSLRSLFLHLKNAYDFNLAEINITHSHSSITQIQ